MKEFTIVKIGLLLLLALLGLCAVRGEGHLTRLDIAVDGSCTSISEPDTRQPLVDVAIAHARHQLEGGQGAEGGEVLQYCEGTCTAVYPTVNCGKRNVTYTLLLKISGGRLTSQVILVNKTIVAGNAHEFVCFTAHGVPGDPCTGQWVNLKQTSSSSSPPADKKGLIIGLVMGLAALAGVAAAASLLYRKFRHNDVSDVSDTTGILGGTPVVNIGEAPNSVAPAGTS